MLTDGTVILCEHIETQWIICRNLEIKQFQAHSSHTIIFVDSDLRIIKSNICNCKKKQSRNDNCVDSATIILLYYYNTIIIINVDVHIEWSNDPHIQVHQLDMQWEVLILLHIDIIHYVNMNAE